MRPPRHRIASVFGACFTLDGKRVMAVISGVKSTGEVVSFTSQFVSGGFGGLSTLRAGTPGEAVPVVISGETVRGGISGVTDPVDPPGKTCSRHSSCAMSAF